MKGRRTIYSERGDIVSVFVVFLSFVATIRGVGLVSAEFKRGSAGLAPCLFAPEREVYVYYRIITFA
jgi:hypothetical protein